MDKRPRKAAPRTDGPNKAGNGKKTLIAGPPSLDEEPTPNKRERNLRNGFQGIRTIRPT